MTARTFVPVLAAACLVALGCDKTPTGPQLVPSTPSFITNGSLDGSAHPATVLILMDENGVPSWLCSGTLIAPKVVLTAGHWEKAELWAMLTYWSLAESYVMAAWTALMTSVPLSSVRVTDCHYGIKS